MKISFAVFALINNISAELGTWDSAGYCAPGYELDTLSNTEFSLQDCADWCVANDMGYGGEMCCDYEGWTSGLSDCTLYGDATGLIEYENFGAYGNTTYNFYSGMTFTSGDGDFAAADLPVGTECVNDDSTGDSGGDTCSMYYDGNYAGCGNYDTYDFSSWDQCCECGGGLGASSSTDATDEWDEGCMDDNTVGDRDGDTCEGYYN